MHRHWDVRWIPWGFWQRFTARRMGRRSWFVFVFAAGPIQIRWWKDWQNAQGRAPFRVVRPSIEV